MLQSQLTRIIRLGTFTLFATAVSSFATAQQAAEPPAPLVSVKQAKQQQVTPTIWLAGDVISRQHAQLSSEHSGRIEWILDIGDKVQKGDPIAQLDTREKQLQLGERQAQVRRQQARIGYFKKQQKRLSELLTTNNTARIELDEVERDLQVAQEELAVLRMQTRQIELEIEKMTLAAPFEGQVNRRLAQPGEYVAIGSMLLQLVDPESIDISVAAPLSVAPFIQSDSEVLVQAGDKLINLPIRAWSPAGDLSTRTFNLRVDAADSDLLIGTGVRVSLPSAAISDSTLVPRDALVLRDKETFVITIGNDKTARKVSVLLGRGVGDWISVNGLVAPGDRVVIRGGERLREGQKVRLANEQPGSSASNIASN